MKKKLLLVEYDSATIEDIKLVFANPVFELDLSEDGVKAKKLIKKNKYDLVITAAMLPKFHGFNLAKYVSEVSPETKTIVISGVYKGIDYKRQAISQYGAVNFFEKPLNREEFKKVCYKHAGVDLEDAGEKIDHTATRIPDQTTHPIMNPEIEQKQTNYSSEDMFGDIIKEVESTPDKYAKDATVAAQETRIPEIKKEVIKVVRNKDTDKKIEDEISKKFEETLSGLGLSNFLGGSSKKTKPVKVKSEEPQQEESKQEEPKQEEPVKVKSEEPQQEEPKQEEPVKVKSEEPQQEEPKQEEPVEVKSEEPKREESKIKQSKDLEPLSEQKSPSKTKEEADALFEQQEDPSEEDIENVDSLFEQEALADEAVEDAEPLFAQKKLLDDKVDEVPPLVEEDKKQKLKPDVEKDSKQIPADTKNEAYGYDILGLIARGGMAELYKARKHGVKGFEKVIALKKILSGYGEDDKFIEMFVDEAKIAAELTHPNIVQIYDLGKEDNNYFIAMEYVEGKDLRLILRKLNESKQKLPEELSLYVVIKILSALEYAHSAKNGRGISLKIVHRDISPPNILLSYTGEVKLTDFGVSKASIKMHQTVSGSLKGKLLYMSPEQAKGDKDIDYRADLFSAGIILYELLLGVKPFLDSSEMGVLKKLHNAEFIKPSEIDPDINPEIERIILKALSKNREDRYQNAEDMSKELEAYIDSNFNLAPNVIHLVYFLNNLFESEITKNGIKLPPRKRPKEIIKKIQKVVVESKISSKDQKKEFKLSKGVENNINKDILFLEEEFKPVVEIDFEKDTKSKDKKEQISPNILSEIEEDKKSGKKGLLIAAIVIAVLIGGYFAVNEFVLKKSGIAGGVQKQQEIPKSEITDQNTIEGTVQEDNPVFSQDFPENNNQSDIDAIKTDDGFSENTEKTKEDNPEDKQKQDEPDQQNLSSNNSKQNQPKNEVIKESRTKDRGSDSKKPTQKNVKKNSSKSRQKKNVNTDKKKAKVSDQQKNEEKDKNKPQEEIVEEKKEEVVSPVEEKSPPKPVVSEGMIFKSVEEIDGEPALLKKVDYGIKTKLLKKMKNQSEIIVVSYLVDHHGNVVTAKMIRRSSSFEIDLLIASAIKKWKYKPPTKDGVKVKVWMSKRIDLRK